MVLAPRATAPRIAVAVTAVLVLLAQAWPALANHNGEPLDLEEFEQNEECDMTVYMESYNANKDELLTKGQQCHEAINEFTLHPYGPPTGWETFNLLCKGICVEYYFQVLDVNTAGGCKCLPYAASETWARFVRREDPMCFKYPIEMFCDIMGGICEPHAFYHRHTCRGCGWEASNEDQWREERDPDFGCGAGSIGVTVWLVVAAAAAAVLMTVTGTGL